jgi:glycine/D-amino acid oxidase-like deaminating enzyme
MLLWEIDRSLTQLTEAYGFERASRAYQASLQAVSGLKSLVAELGIACDMRDKDSLYLAAGPDAKELVEEHPLRRRANLPGAFLDHAMLLEHFGIARAGAIVSPGAADADPMLLAHGLLSVARGCSKPRQPHSTPPRVRSACNCRTAIRSKRAMSCLPPAM